MPVAYDSEFGPRWLDGSWRSVGQSAFLGDLVILGGGGYYGQPASFTAECTGEVCSLEYDGDRVVGSFRSGRVQDIRGSWYGTSWQHEGGFELTIFPSGGGFAGRWWMDVADTCQAGQRWGRREGRLTRVGQNPSYSESMVQLRSDTGAWIGGGPWVAVRSPPLHQTCGLVENLYQRAKMNGRRDAWMQGIGRQGGLMPVGFGMQGTDRAIRIGKTSPHALGGQQNDWAGVTIQAGATGRRVHYSFQQLDRLERGSVNQLIMAVCEETGISRGNMTLLHQGMIKPCEAVLSVADTLSSCCILRTKHDNTTHG